jgi:hypothetical protein
MFSRFFFLSADMTAFIDFGRMMLSELLSSAASIGNSLLELLGLKFQVFVCWTVMLLSL